MLKIKKGDTVKVIAGGAKLNQDGKQSIGKVLRVDSKNNRVLVEGVNIVKVHQKPTEQNQQGGIIEKEAYIHISNVALYDESAKKHGRVGFKIDKDGKKSRYLKSTGKEI